MAKVEEYKAIDIRIDSVIYDFYILGAELTKYNNVATSLGLTYLSIKRDGAVVHNGQNYFIVRSPYILLTYSLPQELAAKISKTDFIDMVHARQTKH